MALRVHNCRVCQRGARALFKEPHPESKFTRAVAKDFDPGKAQHKDYGVPPWMWHGFTILGAGSIFGGFSYQLYVNRDLLGRDESKLTPTASSEGGPQGIYREVARMAAMNHTWKKELDPNNVDYEEPIAP